MIVCLHRALEKLPVSGRPVSQALGPEAIYAQRKPLYEKYAEVTVNVDDLTITAAARKVASALKGLVPEA